MSHHGRNNIAPLAAFLFLFAVVALVICGRGHACDMTFRIVCLSLIVLLILIVHGGPRGHH